MNWSLSAIAVDDRTSLGFISNTVHIPSKVGIVVTVAVAFVDAQCKQVLRGQETAGTCLSNDRVVVTNVGTSQYTLIIY